MQSEIRVKNKETGGEKCSKLPQVGAIPVKSLMELAEHYGKRGGNGTPGTEKYELHNWRKGIAWSLHYDASQRHQAAFWDGEDIDLENNSKHVIAAAWHLMNLAWAMDNKPELDDRPVTLEAKENEK